MKKTLLKITAITIFAAAIVGAPALSRAQDATTTPAAKPAAEKFYGPVTAVDTNAMTFTVGDQTFNVTSGSQLTKDGKPAILADAVVGEPARGSYVTGSDGKLNATKVRFGKKSSKAGGKSGGKKKKSTEGADTGSTDTNAPAMPPANQ